MGKQINKSYAKIWTDDSIPCVFTRIKRLATKSELDELLAEELVVERKLFKKSEKIFSIVDLSEADYLTEEMAFRYLINIFQPHSVKTLNTKLFVKPKSKITSDSLLYSIFVLQSPQVKVYETFEEALKEVNRLRLEARAQAEGREELSLFRKLSKAITSILLPRERMVEDFLKEG